MWKLQEKDFNIKTVAEKESIYTLGNGHLGFRGDFEDPIENVSQTGTYINGFYETSEINYGERAYGFPDTNESLINLFNPKIIRLKVNGEIVSAGTSIVLNYSKELDMQKGYSLTSVVLKNKTGNTFKITAQRLVSFDNKNLGIIRYSVISADYSGEIEIITGIDFENISANEDEFDPRKGTSRFALEYIKKDYNEMAHVSEVVANTVNSHKTVSCYTKDIINTGKSSVNNQSSSKGVFAGYKFIIDKNTEILVDRFILLQEELSNNYSDIRKKEIDQIANNGASLYFQNQEKYLSKYWSKADIQIHNNKELNLAIRYNLFQLFQSIGTDGKTSIAAKGLSGTGYDGHYFWESETYIFPVMLYSVPDVAKQMLMYRYSILDKAREQAKILGHNSGALYSWRSISGSECSAYFPAGSAQYHLNGDVAFAVKKYVNTTNDTQFLTEYGAEIIIETARLWIDVGHYNQKGFCIDCVTGPDEYTAIVNNNAYTNLMAQENLSYAAELKELSAKPEFSDLNEVFQRLNVSEDEFAQFKKASKNMYLPYDEKLGIYKQDDTFLDKKPINHNELKKVLLTNYHPLFIYRHQVCKQADLILAELLLSDKFSVEQKRRDYDYYEKITTHDSSLSSCVFSIIGYEIGETEKGFELFLNTLYSDLHNLHMNTGDGLHMANMAGAWGCIVQGFGGFRNVSGVPYFSPVCPREIDGYCFKLLIGNSLVEVDVKNDKVVYNLISGNIIEIIHKGEKAVLETSLMFNI